MSNQYDLIAVGGGSGGLASAQRAAEYGARALVIERGLLGGTCVNVGCVPKKVMWHAAELAQAFRDAPNYGFESMEPAHDWGQLVERREAYIRRLNGIYERNLDNRSVDWVEGNAKFVDAHTVDVDGVQYTAPHIIVATGGEPVVPDLPGAELGMTSDGFFALSERPQRVAVVGSGYIAIELAGVLSSLGSQVDLFARFNSVLRSMDDMLQESVITALTEHGTNVRLNSPPGSVEETSESISLGYFVDRDFGQSFVDLLNPLGVPTAQERLKRLYFPTVVGTKRVMQTTVEELPESGSALQDFVQILDLVL